MAGIIKNAAGLQKGKCIGKQEDNPFLCLLGLSINIQIVKEKNVY